MIRQTTPRLVFGLGNPGTEYEQTRHNAGFLAIDELAERLSVRVDKRRRGARVAETTIDGRKVLLIKPQTYMNLSGVCVLDFAAYYKVPVSDILVLYDDSDLPLGTVRVRAFGSAGTQKGMKDIVARLGSEAFPRVRIGIGQKPQNWDMADFVLSRPAGTEKTLFLQGVARGAGAALTVLREGVPPAQALFNGAPDEGGE